MKRFRAWMPMLLLFLVIATVQGLLIAGLAPDSGDSDAIAVQRQDEWSWSDIGRDDGPILERIPAPYVVLTILSGAGVAIIGWYVLVRWTDISETL
jgi:hypothetical protein